MNRNFGFVIHWWALALAGVLMQSYLSNTAEGFNVPAIYSLEDIVDTVSNEELDALYPITRYAGMGYNLLRGNPEGSFETGGKDPGIHNTRWIFNLTYTMNKEGFYCDKTVAVPDQVEFHPMEACASQSFTRTYSGQTSYQKELENNINLGVSGG